MIAPSTRFSPSRSSPAATFCTVTTSKNRLTSSGGLCPCIPSAVTRGSRRARSPATRTNVRRWISSATHTCNSRRRAWNARNPNSSAASTTIGWSRRPNATVPTRLSTAIGVARFSRATNSANTAIARTSPHSGRNRARSVRYGEGCPDGPPSWVRSAADRPATTNRTDPAFAFAAAATAAANRRPRAVAGSSAPVRTSARRPPLPVTHHRPGSGSSADSGAKVTAAAPS